MNDQSASNEFDTELKAVFEREHTHVASEPFVSTTLRAVAAEQRRKEAIKRLGVAAVVAGVVLFSPQLIAASVWVSAELDALFALLSTWLASPQGKVLAGLVAVAVFVAARSRSVRGWPR